MSDGTQGPGWWQASDGQWYPPEQHADFQAGATKPVEPPPPPPTSAMPPVAPMPPPVGPPPGSPAAASSNAKWIVVGVLAVAAVAVAAFLLLGGDDKEKTIGLELEPSASSSSSPSSSSRSSSSSSRSSSSSSPASSSQLDQADLQARMLNAADVGPGFVDDTFTVDTGPTNCGGPNRDQQVRPKSDLGSQSSNGVASFQEEAIAYSSSADAQKVLDLFKAQTACPSPTIPGGGPISFSDPKDVSSSVTTRVEAVFEIDFETAGTQGQFFIIKDGVAIVTFTLGTQKGTDTSQLPTAISLVNKGLKKIVA